MPADRGDEKRPRATYRRFLYLDSEDIVNSLSSVQGGLVEKATERVLESAGKNLGGSLAAGGARLELGGKKGRDVERQMELRQTVHFAVSALLDELEGAREIVHASAVGLGSIEENALLELHADLYLCRSERSQARALEEDANRSLWERLFGRSDPQSALRKQGLGAEVIAIADVTDAGWKPVVLRLQSEYLRVDPSHFCRRATIVGQVEGRPQQDELVKVIDDGDGSRASIAKRNDATREIRFTGIGGGLPQSSSHMDVQSISMRDFDGWLPNGGADGLPNGDADGQMQIDTVLVRPLCIYK
jgi:hypothetical protein